MNLPHVYVQKTVSSDLFCLFVCFLLQLKRKEDGYNYRKIQNLHNSYCCVLPCPYIKLHLVHAITQLLALGNTALKGKTASNLNILLSKIKIW